jgi:hypothetical protein
MEPQTLQPQAPTTNPAPQASGIDPTALALSRSIRQVESNGNYNAVGDNGTSHGAYQFHGDNFQTWAKQYGLDPSDMSQNNQDEVAYKRIEGMLQEGSTPSEVAARWNGATYSNGQYTAINPAYPAKVGRAYTQIAAQMTGQTQGQYSPGNTGLGGFAQSAQPADTTASPTTPAPTSSTGILSDLSSGNYGGAAVQAGKDVTNFALPIVGDLYHDIQGKSDKSILQQAGDLGMSALWFLPFGDIAEGLGEGVKALTGLGEAGAAADAVAGGGALAMGGATATGDVAIPAITKAGQIGSKIAQGAGVVGTGLLTGYGSDVASHLAQGQTGAGVLKPGLGTVLGGGLAGASLGAGALYNKFLGEQSVVDKVQSAYEDAFGATKSGIQKGSSIEARSGTSPAEFLANAGIPPETDVVNGRRVFTTGPDSNTYQAIQERADALTNLRDKAISQSGATNNFEELRQQMLTKAQQDFSGTALTSAQAQINKEMDALAVDPKYSIDAQGNISAADTTKIKSYLAQRGKFDNATPNNVLQTYQTMSSVAKQAVEDSAEASDVPSIKALNKLIQQHLDFLDTNGKKGLLSKLNGQVIKGGRLGKYLDMGIGAAAGEGISGALGGGLVGSIAGPIAGAALGSKVSDFMQKLAVGGPMSAATIGRMATEDPEVVQQFLQYIGEQGGDKIAPNVQPIQKSAGGLIQGLMNKTPGSLIAQRLGQ